MLLSGLIAFLFSSRQPTGNTSAPYWTHEVALGVSHASVDDQLSGLGLTGVWGAQNAPGPKGDTARERAEVWFDRA